MQRILLAYLLGVSFCAGYGPIDDGSYYEGIPALTRILWYVGCSLAGTLLGWWLYGGFLSLGEDDRVSAKTGAFQALLAVALVSVFATFFGSAMANCKLPNDLRAHLILTLGGTMLLGGSLKALHISYLGDGRERYKGY